MTFDTTEFSPLAARLILAAPAMPLGPGRPVRERHAELEALSPSTLLAPAAVVDPEMALAALAGLWLRFDYLDESHTISQDLHSATGSYWHGLMHRREPDYGNAKYWFHRVGRHPVFVPLCETARDLATALGPDHRTAFLVDQANWDPGRFVDLCQDAARDRTLEPLCVAIQHAEWELLFHNCYWRAIGKVRERGLV